MLNYYFAAAIVVIFILFSIFWIKVGPKDKKINISTNFEDKAKLLMKDMLQTNLEREEDD